MKIKKNIAETEEKLGSLRHVPLDHLVDRKDIENRDIIPDHVEFLKESIAKAGLDVPLIAWTGGDENNQMSIKDAKHGKQTLPATFLIAGFHRREALKRLRKEDPTKFAKLFPDGVPVKVMSGSIEDALLAQLRENLARENPTAADVLPFMKRLIDAGMKKKHIATRIGKSPSYVTMVMQIDEELGDEAGDDLKKGDIDLVEGSKAAKKAKSGKLSKREALDEARAKTKKKKDKGHKRAEKRVSLKKAKAAYDALPNMNMGKRLQILEGIVDYVLGEEDELPDELDFEEEEEPKKKKKKNK